MKSPHIIRFKIDYDAGLTQERLAAITAASDDMVAAFRALGGAAQRLSDALGALQEPVSET